MATYVQRGSSTRAQVRKCGYSLSATFDTRTEAEKWAANIEERIARGEAINEDEFGENPSVLSIMTRYLNEVSPTKRYPKNDMAIYRRVKDIDVFKKRLSNFSAADLRAWRDARLKQVSSGSVLRELCFISIAFTHGIQEWGLPLTQNPTSLIKWPRKGKSRCRRVSDKEIAELMKVLGNYDCTYAPETACEWTAWCVHFALATAMRRGEIATMTWGNLHTAEKFVHLPLTKNGKARNVPLSKVSIGLLELLPEGAPGQRIVQIALDTISMYFGQACKDAGLENLHFHDLRHEATTRIAKKLRPRGGVDDVSLIKLGAITGHDSVQMLKIYFNPTATEMASELDRLDALD